jgi:cysteine desulfurase/selenocysteine lyase
MDSLIDPREYAALSECTYLNQASLGLIPRASLEASVRFLKDVAQHGNLRLSDQAEAEVLDTLRTAAAGLLDAPLASVAVVGGASEGLSQLAATLSGPDGEVILVPSDFPSVTYPWLAVRERCGMRIRWVPDVADDDLTLSLAGAIDERTTVVCASAVQYATGSLIDVADLVAGARRAGARVAVDVTQMAGAVPVTMADWGADALVCSGYKWLSAPGGVALLAVADDLAAAIPRWSDGKAVPHRSTSGRRNSRWPRTPGDSSCRPCPTALPPAARVHQAADRDRADVDTRARWPTGSGAGRADCPAGLDAVSGTC